MLRLFVCVACIDSDTEAPVFTGRSHGIAQHRKELSMWDLGCVATSVAFFAIAILYIYGCGRLDFTERK
jgi:hypothetical protein